MKILLVNDYGTEVGGVETYILALKEALSARGHDVRIFSSTTSSRPATFSDYTFPGIDEGSLFRFLPYMFNVRALRGLLRVLRTFRPDVVHLHYIFYDCSPSILLALKRYPTVCTLHAHELLAPVGVQRTAYCEHGNIGYCRHCVPGGRYVIERIKRIVWWTLRGVIDVYVAPSGYYRECHVAYGLRNVVVVSNGVRLFEYAPLTCSKQLLFVGRLECGKGAHVLIRAMADIHREVPASRLVVVGSGSEEVRLRELVTALQLGDAVMFVGKVGHELVEDWYVRSDVVCVPSISDESFGLVGVEAMSVGRPVIGSNVGGVPDWLLDGEVGFLVSANDSAAIAAAALRLLSNERLLEKMSRQANSAAVNFGMENHVDKLMALYGEYVQ